VSLKTSLKGNVRYSTLTLEGDHITDDGARRARWETERTVMDPAEHEAGIKARSLARSRIQCVCANSAFGLLCPEASADKLEAAVAEARAIVDAFNRTATLTRLSFNLIAGKIAPDDVEAIRAINSEMSDLLASMAEGLSNLDVAKVRDAANKAKSVGAMLTPAAQEAVQAAIDVARKTARQIVTAAEEGTAEIDRAAIRKVLDARTGFLDVDLDAEAPAADPIPELTPAQEEEIRQRDDDAAYASWLDGEQTEEPEAVIAPVATPVRTIDLED
jgi:hypothetical protein